MAKLGNTEIIGCLVVRNILNVTPSDVGSQFSSRDVNICGQNLENPFSSQSAPNINIFAGCKGSTGTNNIGGCVNIVGGIGCTTSTSAVCGGHVNICGGNTINTGSGAQCGGHVCIVGGTNNGGTGTRRGGDVCIASGAGSVFGEVCIFRSTGLRYCTTGTGSYIQLCLNVQNCGIAQDWVATSDFRIKKDIQPISNALSTVNQLCGVCYKLCDDEKNENRVGLIAQDVEVVLPEVVSKTEPSVEDKLYGIEDVKYGLKYEKISAVIIEAIKEQQNLINNLQKRIVELEHDVFILKNNIQR